MTRPRSHIRVAVAEEISAADGLHWRELAERLEARGLINTAAPSELELVAVTVRHMVREGRLRRVGDPVQVAGIKRPLQRLVAANDADAGAQRLSAAMGGWAAQR